jgi:hypothetical protein
VTLSHYSAIQREQTSATENAIYKHRA